MWTTLCGHISRDRGRRNRLMRRTHNPNTVFPAIKIHALPNLAILATEGTRGAVPHEPLMAQRQFRRDVGAQRQGVVLLLADEGAHEEHEDGGALGVWRAGRQGVGARRMPQAALEDERRAGGARSCDAARDVEDVRRRDVAEVRGGEDSGRAVAGGVVGEAPHYVLRGEVWLVGWFYKG